VFAGRGVKVGIGMAVEVFTSVTVGLAAVVTAGIVAIGDSGVFVGEIEVGVGFEQATKIKEHRLRETNRQKYFRFFIVSPTHIMEQDREVS
jgi:hypothetical protein